MVWIIAGVITALLLGGFVYAVWKQKIIFTSGRGFEGGRSRTFEIIDKKHFSAAVGPDGQARGLDELPPDPRAKAEETLASGAQKFEKIVVNINGERREYSSIDEVPAELRSRIESVKKEGASGPGPHREIIIKKDGKTYTYNSIDEVPLEFRIFLKRKKQF